MNKFYKKQKEKSLKKRIKELEGRIESTRKETEKEIQNINERIADCKNKLAKIYAVRGSC